MAATVQGVGGAGPSTWARHAAQHGQGPQQRHVVAARSAAGLGPSRGLSSGGSRAPGAMPCRRTRKRTAVLASSSGTPSRPSSGAPGPSAGDDDDFDGMDWRTFRARLVAQAQALQSVSGASHSQQTQAGLEIWQDRMSIENWAVLASQNPQLAKEVPWVHSTAGPEVGGALLASPTLNRSIDERYRQVVILVTQHDSRGSAGLILNRPSGYTLKKAMSQVNSVDASLSVFAGNAIYVGGYRSDGRTLHFLHGHPLPGAEELAPGVFMGGLEAAAEKVLEGALPASDFRFFVGRVEWLPGRLEDELSKGAWFPAASARSLLLKQCLQLPKPLWREMLELMGGDYAETAKREYGEIP